MHGGLPGISGRYAETSAAALVAAARVHPDDPVRTALLQGPAPSVRGVGARRVLSLVLRLDRPGPAAGPLAEVRRVLDGLAGTALPARWDDVTAARRGTGR